MATETVVVPQLTSDSGWLWLTSLTASGGSVGCSWGGPQPSLGGLAAISIRLIHIQQSLKQHSDLTVQVEYMNYYSRFSIQTRV